MFEKILHEKVQYSKRSPGKSIGRYNIFSSLLVGGLWKLIKPLETGEHDIFFKSGEDKRFSRNVTYSHIVESGKYGRYMDYRLCY